MAGGGLGGGGFDGAGVDGAGVDGAGVDGAGVDGESGGGIDGGALDADAGSAGSKIPCNANPFLPSRFEVLPEHMSSEGFDGLPQGICNRAPTFARSRSRSLCDEIFAPNCSPMVRALLHHFAVPLPSIPARRCSRAG